MTLSGLIVFLLLPFLLCARQQQDGLRHYGMEQGLPQNSITTIQFDRWGYCWLGTEDGLVRFDGRHFTVFNEDNIPGLQSGRIRQAALDTSGLLHFVNQSKQQLVIEQPWPGAVPVPRLLTVTKGWIPSLGGYLVTAPALKQRLEKEHQAADNGSLRYQELNMGPGGLYVVDNNRLLWTADSLLQPAGSFRNWKEVIHLVVDEWLLTWEKGGGMQAWKQGRRQPGIHIQGPLQQNKAFRQGTFTSSFTHGQSYILADSILYRIRLDKGRLLSEVALRQVKVPVVSFVFCHAAQQQYFIGSLVSGLHIISPNRFHYPAQPPDAPAEGFFAQVQTDDGSLVCQRTRYWPDGSYQKLQMNQQAGITLFQDRGQLYYGDEPELYRYDLRTHTNTRLRDLDSRPASLFRDQADSNVMILGTSRSVGKLRNDSLLLLKRVPGDPVIMSIFQTGKDSFVIATQQGVKWFDLHQGIVYRTVLDSLYIRSVYQETPNRAWISTMGKGFYLWENGQLHQFPVHPFDALKTIHAFVDDGRGNFWLPTNNGLYSVPKKALLDHAAGNTREIVYYQYTTADQLRTNEFNGGCIPAYQWLKDSILSLPTIAGIVQFRPHQLPVILPDHPVYIDRLLLDNRPVDDPGMLLRLAPDYSRLTVVVNTPYFGQPANLRLLYRIEGMDEHWQELPEDGSISLNHVAPGNYTLRVRKQGEPEETGGLALSFAVAPWFYNTWWFYCLLLLAIGTVVYWVIRTRTRILLARNHRLQAIIAEQTQDLNKTVEQLIASEKALKESNQTKDRVTAMVLHDLRSPIRFLHTLSSQLLKGKEQMNREQLHRQLYQLRSSTGALNDFTEQFFTWAASQHKDFKVTMENFALQDLLDELEELYMDMALVNGNELLIEPVDLDVRTDRQILAIIIRNLIDNANKHTGNSLIRVTARETVSHWIVSVSDTGPGLDAAAMDRFTAGGAQAGTSGNGSMIVQNLAEKIGAELQLQTGNGQGTVVRILLHRC